MISCAIFITFLADTLGRRWSLVGSGYALFVFMFYIGFFVRFDPPKADQPAGSAGTAALVMVYLFAAAFQFGWGPVCWIYVSEIPTNRLRGYTVSLAAATQWVWNLVVTRVTPIMLRTLGSSGSGTYFLYGCCCFTMASLAFFLPETKGVSLTYREQSELLRIIADLVPSYLWSEWMSFSAPLTFPALRIWERQRSISVWTTRIWSIRLATSDRYKDASEG